MEDLDYLDNLDYLENFIEGETDDDMIQRMYFQYIFVFIYFHKIETIQRYYRYYRFKKYFYKLKKSKHKLKMNQCFEDIIEVGYFPPTEEYQLFQKGGFRYREGLQSFNECLLNII